MLRTILAGLLVLACLGCVHSSSCPIPNLIEPCTCSKRVESLNINCDASVSDGNVIRSALQNFTDLPIILSITINNIDNIFNVVPDNFLPSNSNEIHLTFNCNHGHNATTSVLKFETLSMHSTDSFCLLKKFRTQHCNLDHFDASVFSGCDHLWEIDFANSNVQSFVNTSYLPSLNALYIYGWEESGGLKSIDITADKVPKLDNLVLDVGQLGNDDVAFVSEITNLRVLHLRSKLSNVPDLSKLKKLYLMEIFIDRLTSSLSINMPSEHFFNGVQLTLQSLLNETFSISDLQGFFDSDTIIDLNLKLDKLDESVFSAPLKHGLEVRLHSDLPFQCDCYLAWLIRQPLLLDRVEMGKCTDGRRFEDLHPDEFSDCLY